MFCFFQDHPDGMTNEKTPRGGKGVYSSRNAYMLVYTRRDAIPAGI